MPRPTIRLRLTAWYAGLFLAFGTLLLGLSYVVVRQAFAPEVERRLSPGERPAPAAGGTGGSVRPAAEPAEVERRVLAQERRRDERSLSEVLVRFAASLGGVTLVSVLVGWLIAGRALAPVSRITETARRVSGQSLHQRIALDGPRDELKELADTFDAMLQRLDSAFAGQRRFIADASHELRTPLAIIRAELEELQDSDLADGEQEAMVANARRAATRGERLINSLLTLARSEGVLQGKTVDLAAVARTALRSERCSPADGVVVTSELQAAEITGDPILLESLVVNLAENGLRHNHESGNLHVTVRPAGDAVELEVTNTGPSLERESIDTLFNPFTRGHGSAPRHREGSGLGLSIVRAVVAAHGGSVEAVPAVPGGLRVTVRLPAAAQRPVVGSS